MCKNLTAVLLYKSSVNDIINYNKGRDESCPYLYPNIQWLGKYSENSFWRYEWMKEDRVNEQSWGLKPQPSSLAKRVCSWLPE